MIIGIIPNINKEKIEDVLLFFVERLRKFDIGCIILDDIRFIESKMPDALKDVKIGPIDMLCRQSDMIASIGGDGTMLNTAYLVRKYDKPVIGVNFGKLGFLAEFDMDNLDVLLNELKTGKYSIEERIVLEGECLECHDKKLFAINDIVIDKGGWPKMVEITIKVDEDYVTTFSADGLILATPTGSTGYSLSTGGPIVTPDAEVITLSPISPHTLTMRPLVLSSSHSISVKVNSPYNTVQVNCDGQRVFNYKPPVELRVYKSSNKIRLIRTNSTNYFKILREKLFWGLDVRKKPWIQEF